MGSFRLSDEALADVHSVWVYLLKRAGLRTADRVVKELFDEFQKLADAPNRGHRRLDLTSKEVLFVRLYSYLIIYEPRTSPVSILAVLHGKRNVRRLLLRRV